MTHIVREVGWWDYYLVCEKHVVWARTQFRKGMRLYERAYNTGPYREIASGCTWTDDEEALAARRKRTRAQNA